MEQTEIIIVGAGPSGLTLALTLASRQVKCVLLELNEEICEDPRAIALTGDTTRIMHLVGVTTEKFKHIGQPVRDLNFHETQFTSEPYLTLDHTHDWMGQALIMSILIFQPRLEQAMRNLVNASKYAELRTSCRVTSCRESENGVEATYVAKDGSTRQLQGKFLVGADGKRGMVRKHYLEARGIRQSVGSHSYEATWIAANLRMTMPTQVSHPDFPLWQLDYKSEELWDLFWPAGFHFCNHPKTPVAAGRFGPAEEKYWRFEYELPPGYKLEDPIEDLKTQMLPHLAIPASKIRNGSRLSTEYVQFPWDCVEVVRCGPAFFAHKTANRWYDGRVILIGDAAHVFPPFGGQGATSAIRDAMALAWRLKLALELQGKAHTKSNDIAELLELWSEERKRGVEIASELTMINGNLLLNKSWLMRKVLSCAHHIVNSGLIRNTFYPWLNSDAEGYRYAKNGHFLSDCYGGRKTGQIFVTDCKENVILSDELFWRQGSALTVLATANDVSEDEVAELDKMIESTNPNLVAREVVTISLDQNSTHGGASKSSLKQYFACDQQTLVAAGIEVRPGYDPKAFSRRFNQRTRFALVRPDFIVFSQASTIDQLGSQLERAQNLLFDSEAR